MSNKIFVMNTRDRYYNGAHKGGILEIDAENKEQYLRVGFVEVTNNATIEIKENIVSEKGKNMKELKGILEHHGISIPKDAKKADLEKLLKDFEDSQAQETNTDEEKIKMLREKMLAEGIISESDTKTDEEILELAKTNGFLE